MADTQTVSATCGIAKLLAATFGKPLTEIFPQVGLELCPQCGEASKDPTTYPFCSQQHYLRFSRAAVAVPLICDECGIFFVRPEAKVLQWAKRGGQKIYCSKVCLGKYTGRTYGIGTPGNPLLEATKARGMQTHCRRGHEMTPENTYTYSSRRHCKACRRKKSREWYARKRAADRANS